MLWTRIEDGDMEGAFSILNLPTEIVVTKTGTKQKSKRTAVEPKDSIFLTAFLLKCFGLAKNWIDIDEKHINGAVKFLLGQQLLVRSFPQHGVDEVAKFEGGSLYGRELEYFVSTALLENWNDNITTSLVVVGDCHISLYLQMLGYKFGDGPNSAVNQLLTSFIVYPGDVFLLHSHEWSIAYAEEIEKESYKLLALLEYQKIHFDSDIGRTENAIYSSIQFLVSRIGQKGFFSTIDTMIGLQSLTNAAKNFYSRGSKVEVTSMTEKYNLKPSNTKIRFQLSPKPDEDEETFSLTFSGEGIAALEIESINFAWRLNSIRTRFNIEQYYDIDISLDPNVPENDLLLTICYTYKGYEYHPNMRHPSFTPDRMILQLPEGYEYDTDFEIYSSATISVSQIEKEAL